MKRGFWQDQYAGQQLIEKQMGPMLYHTHTRAHTGSCSSAVWVHVCPALSTSIPNSVALDNLALECGFKIWKDGWNGVSHGTLTIQTRGKAESLIDSIQCGADVYHGQAIVLGGTLSSATDLRLTSRQLLRLRGHAIALTCG